MYNYVIEDLKERILIKESLLRDKLFQREIVLQRASLLLHTVHYQGLIGVYKPLILHNSYSISAVVPLIPALDSPWYQIAPLMVMFKKG